MDISNSELAKQSIVIIETISILCTGWLEINSS